MDWLLISKTKTDFECNLNVKATFQLCLEGGGGVYKLCVDNLFSHMFSPR